MSGPSRMKNPKQSNQTADQRRMRRNQVIFSILAVIIIISWIASLLINI
jgi:hypothetical protein